jgi:hypothetical protein
MRDASNDYPWHTDIAADSITSIFLHEYRLDTGEHRKQTAAD